MCRSNSGRSPRLVGAGVLALAIAAGMESSAADKRATKEVAELYREDQADQQNAGMSWDELSARQGQRRDRVMEILAAGELDEPVAFHHASWILQHGERPMDFLLAHVLASAAGFAGLDEARFMSAAGLDRYLQTIGRPQRFGSQFADEKGEVLIEPYDESLSQVVVGVFADNGLRGRPADPDDRTKKALKSASRELGKLAKQARRWKPEETADPDESGADPDAEDPRRAALARVREIVARGQLDDEGDFLAAALVLSKGSDREDLFLAHVLATAAALQDEKKARRLAAETLDRWLRTVGEPQLFGTIEEPEEDAEGEAPSTREAAPRLPRALNDAFDL